MKFLNRCWCLLLGALLPSACSDNLNEPVEYGPPTPEYGVPQATVILDGVVVDNLGAPVRDIVVGLDGFGSTTSDTLGNWSLNENGFSSCITDTMVTCGLEATDVDDTDNGGPYLPVLTVLDLTQTAPGSGYNLGTYEQHGVRIVMEDVGVMYGPECAKAEAARKKDDETLTPE